MINAKIVYNVQCGMCGDFLSNTDIPEFEHYSIAVSAAQKAGWCIRGKTLVNKPKKTGEKSQKEYHMNFEVLFCSQGNANVLSKKFEGFAILDKARLCYPQVIEEENDEYQCREYQFWRVAICERIG